jgi:hypothetical protein
MLSHGTRFSVWLLGLVLCACCSEGKKIKRMETFEFQKFKKHYKNKKPVIIGGMKKYIANASSELFRACGTQQVGLRRMPAMQKDTETISLNEAVLPCGLGCYGLYKEKVCKGAYETLQLPEGVSIDQFQPITVSLAWEGMESSLWRNEEGLFHYVLAGVEEWRFLLHDAGELDLFSQDYYTDKLTPYELLYLPPATLSQHRALTRLSLAVEGTLRQEKKRESAESVESVEVEMLDNGILLVDQDQ